MPPPRAGAAAAEGEPRKKKKKMEGAEGRAADAEVPVGEKASCSSLRALPLRVLIPAQVKKKKKDKSAVLASE